MHHPVRLIALSAISIVILSPGIVAAPPLDVDAVLGREEVLLPRGTTFDAMVPDTLDLAERARLSLGALIGNMDREQFYGVYQGFQLTKEAPAHPFAITWNITVKNARTIPALRVMTGDDFGLADEYRMLRALLGAIDEDGLLYYPFECQGPPKGTSYPQSNACLAMALLNRQALDGNPAWRGWIDLLARGLRQTAIRVEDRAFFPMQAGIDRTGKWRLMNLEGEPPYGRGNRPFDYDPLLEPAADAMGFEGAARAEANRALAFLATHYRISGNRDSRALAERLLRFSLKPGMWTENSDEKRYPGYEHGIWAGHFHNGTQGLCALLELALVTNDNWLKEFCREYYDHARRSGIIRLGWFPAWSSPEKMGNRPAVLGELTEPCALGDLVVAAVRMSDAGLGDYWDDVDSIVRNHLVEQQISDLEQMRKLTGIAPGSDADERLKRFRGSFGGCGLTRLHQPTLAGCCTANGAQGFYYAWHGITRFDNGVATVNLFLNRASAWMDVDSFLPYEGKVVLHNKTAHTALVRIPGWLDAAEVKCRIRFAGAAGKPVEVKPPRTGPMLVFEKLNPQDEIVLEFAVPESTDRYTVAGKPIRIMFRGSTVVAVEPREEKPETDYLLYLREQMRHGRAPIRRVRRFVSEKLVPPGAF